jgi:phospholipase/carboxylesterase
MTEAALWLEFPTISGKPAERLLVFFHGAGSNAAAFAPVALHWHLKFPSAVAVVMESPIDLQQPLPAWLVSTTLSDDVATSASCTELVRRVRSAQLALNLSAEKTIIVAQGASASIALESIRREIKLAQILVTYGGRFASSLKIDEKIHSTVHLIHGELDAQIPVAYATRAMQGLTALGTDATLDILIESSHQLDQDMINVGTTRVMQTLFRGRQKARPAGWNLH